MKAMFLLCLALAGCMSTESRESAPPLRDAPSDAWLDSKAPGMHGFVSDLLPIEWVHKIPPQELPTALKLLESSPVVKLGKGRDPRFPSTPEEITSGDHVYLLRAIDDNEVDRAFAVYQEGAVAAVVSGHIGPCGPLRKSAVIVRGRSKIERVYGGCAGAQ